MNRILLSLATLSTVLLCAAFVLGLNIDDPKAATATAVSQFTSHFWTAMGGLIFTALVHAIVLTYFMGTGRWLEETDNAYKLGGKWRQESQSLKYRTLPLMSLCLLLLIVTGASGAAADPASPYGARGWWGIPASTVHFLTASVTICVNLLVNCYEYTAIHRNGEIVKEVLAEVRRIRQERGLPV